MFITIRNGRVDNISTDKIPGKDCTEVPNDWRGSHGDLLTWFDNSMRRIPDHVLVEQGKRVDNRGRWYNKETREEKLINGLDEAIADAEWTREKPIENEPYQHFDEATGKWVVEAEKKENAEKEAAVAEVKMKIENAERKINRPMRAIQAGRATEDDLKVFNEYDTLIENDLRPKLKELEAELKSA